jgi:hypothetical protein
MQNSHLPCDALQVEFGIVFLKHFWPLPGIEYALNAIKLVAFKIHPTPHPAPPPNGVRVHPCHFADG